MRVFLDTNILLDILLERKPFVEASEKVILLCENLGADTFIAWHGLATLYYLLKRGRTEEEALFEIDKFLPGPESHTRRTLMLAEHVHLGSVILKMLCKPRRRRLAPPIGW